jgi:GNAT superfamily N-acetyltransferase
MKRLFISAPASSMPEFVDVRDTFREMEPLCVLDFYVHERCQRTGHGHRLFEAMLHRECAAPAKLAYDRPSPKLLGFLKRHFRLTKFSPQSNKFVVFDEYFDPNAENVDAEPPRRPNSLFDRNSRAALGSSRSQLARR